MNDEDVKDLLTQAVIAISLIAAGHAPRRAQLMQGLAIECRQWLNDAIHEDGGSEGSLAQRAQTNARRHSLKIAKSYIETLQSSQSVLSTDIHRIGSLIDDALKNMELVRLGALFVKEKIDNE